MRMAGVKHYNKSVRAQVVCGFKADGTVAMSTSISNPFASGATAVMALPRPDPYEDRVFPAAPRSSSLHQTQKITEKHFIRVYNTGHGPPEPGMVPKWWLIIRKYVY